MQRGSKAKKEETRCDEEGEVIQDTKGGKDKEDDQNDRERWLGRMLGKLLAKPQGSEQPNRHNKMMSDPQKRMQACNATATTVQL